MTSTWEAWLPTPAPPLTLCELEHHTLSPSLSFPTCNTRKVGSAALGALSGQNLFWGRSPHLCQYQSPAKQSLDVSQLSATWLSPEEIKPDWGVGRRLRGDGLGCPDNGITCPEDMLSPGEWPRNFPGFRAHSSWWNDCFWGLGSQWARVTWSPRQAEPKPWETGGQ